MGPKEILKPFKASPTGWFIIPRAFWPYKNERKGIPGFRRFMELLDKNLKKRGRWDRDKQYPILRLLSREGIIKKENEVKDYHVYYRNYINFSNKIGFTRQYKNGASVIIKITTVGQTFLSSGADATPYLLEHQLLKLQFSNPAIEKGYEGLK